MSKHLTAALLLSAPVALCAAQAQAQDAGRFTWEGSLEIGNDQVIDSDAPGNEIRDTYAIGEVNAAFALTDRVSVFGGLTWESVTDATADRSFDDMGLYLHELGLQFDLGNTVLRLGKVHPVFGSAWDTAAGFYGSYLADDYELTEMVGAFADVDLGEAGVLSFGLFYADDTVLSESAGFNRGRNDTAFGGAGNTGKLNNASVQWSKDWDDTFVQIGLRYLSAGTGDVQDEKGILAGIGHSFAGGIDVFAELAAFDGYGGTADDATYATLSAAYALGDWSLSGNFATRDVDSTGRTNIFSLGADYEFANGITMGGALAAVDDAGVDDTLFGVNVVIPFGNGA
ncbi:hypothetical protein [Pseudodonghicola flavimaris]|uniref:Porin n=1 Tax=Pseudodonghicola flavimaris TaxID=3050036 RepID=A0ABT7F4S5_9RHOB|nr:hypothetical protein [Pseudodonghicola flavimaris]MDK3019490.1 hypothetical protein [Pseudodonghicola flavimaris]